MEYYFMTIIAVILIAGDFAVNKLYQRKYGTSVEMGLKFNAFFGVFSALIFFVANGFRLELSMYSMVMASIVAVSVMSYNILGFKVLKVESMAFYTLFLMCGGMLVPYVWGVLFLHEKLSFFHVIGLVMIVGSIIITASDKKMPNKHILFLCVVIFFLNGICSIAGKMHQIEKMYHCVSEIEFVIATGIIKFIVATLSYVVVKIKNTDHSAKMQCKVNFSRGVLLTAISAMIGGSSYMLQLNGAKNLPATVVYPLITGGTIFFSSVIGVIFFKDQISKKLISSIILCFVGTCMFL